MIRRLQLILLILVILITSAAVWVSLNTAADKKRVSEVHNALRHAVEFLKPDTASDIRFGQPKLSGTPPLATPTPPAP
jgi:hypothetical protein